MGTSHRARRTRPGKAACAAAAIALTALAPASPAAADSDWQVGWVRQQGTAANDTWRGIGTDSAGNVYVAGTTFGNFPGSGTTNKGQSDVIVSSYTAAGGVRWVRQIGTAGIDQVGSMQVDAAGNTYMVGTTAPGAFSPGSAFVWSLDPAGTTRWSKTVDSTSYDFGYGVALDGLGHVVASGGTNGALVEGSVADGDGDAWVAQFDAATGDPTWVRQIGSTKQDYAWDLAAGPDGSVVLAGDTNDVMPGATATPQGSWDQFVARYDVDGTIQWIKQAGTATNDGGNYVDVDPAGNAYVAGYTEATMPGVTETEVGDYDLHVTSFDPAGNRRWIHQYGSTLAENVEDVQVDAAGTVLVTGDTAGSLPGWTGALGGDDDAYVLALDSQGTRVWTRQFGGPGGENTSTVSAEPDGRVHVAGSTNGLMPATTDTAKGGTDAWVASIGQVWPKPFATWAALVDKLHRSMLGRAPTSAELSTWTTSLGSGSTTPDDLVVALRGSSDHTGNVDPVVRLYRAYLLRIPDPGGLKYWINRRREGRTLQRISDSFASSSEFTRRYGALTNRQFVELVYQNVLGRPGEQSGIDFWTTRLDNKSRTRGGVMLGFSESNEYKRKQKGEVTVSVLSILLGAKAPKATLFADLTSYEPIVGDEAMARDLATRILTDDAYVTG